MSFTVDALRRALCPPPAANTANARRTQTRQFHAALREFWASGQTSDLADMSTRTNGALQGLSLPDLHRGAPHIARQVEQVLAAPFAEPPPYASGTYTPPDPDSLPPEPPTPRNGLCWTVAYRPDVRGRPARALGDNPLWGAIVADLCAHAGDWSGRTFSVKFGTKDLLARGHRYGCHIAVADPTHSALTLHDLLRIIPADFVCGDSEDSADVVAPPSAGPSGGLLGPIVPYGRRRFLYPAATVSATKGGAFTVVQHTPSLRADIAQFTRFVSAASFASLSAVFQSLGSGHEHHVEIAYAWTSSAEVAPVTEDELWAHPNAGLAQIGAAVDSIDTPFHRAYCSFDFGVSQVFKPAPHFGGYPHLTVAARGTPRLSDATATAPLFRLFIEAVVVLS